jgi:DNA-binding CsgD family transcriptional regulator
MRGEDWPLIGRTEEHGRILAGLDGRTGGVLLAGAAGVGKTRLAAEGLAAAAARGFATLRVAATPATAGLPFGAFAAVLPELVAGQDRGQTLRQIAHAIAERGEGRPVALLVDDAHLLDEASAALTHQLATAEKAFVLATVRSRLALPDPVLALWKDGLAERVDLEPLGEEAIGDLLTAGLGGPVEAGARHLFFQRSSGNVLFLREIVLAAVEGNVLRADGGLWRLHARLPASARLVELVENRLAGLADEERESLELLALGEPLGVDVFERIANPALLTGLERRGLVRVAEVGRRYDLHLVHPVYGDVLRALMSPLRTRALSRTLADAVEATGLRRRDDLLRFAGWRLNCGGHIEPAIMVAAANRAWALHDLGLAERLAGVAVEADGGFDAELLAAQMLALTGRAEEAEQRLAALDGDGRADGDAKLGRLAIVRVDNLIYSLGRLDDGLAVVEEAERRIGDPGARNELTAYRGSVLDAAGQTAKALEVVTPLLERATGRALVWAAVIANYGFGKVGQTSRAIDAAERGTAAHRELTGQPLPWNPTVHTSLRSYALLAAGSIAEAEALATEAYELGVAEGSVEARWDLAPALCCICVAQGRVRRAIRWGREAVALAREHGRLVVVRVALIPLAEALALAGEPEEAGRALAELDALPRHVRMKEAEAVRARAWTAVANDDLAGARRLLGEAAEIGADAGDLVSESTALHDLARLGEAGKVVARLAALAELIEGPLAAARAVHAGALVQRDAARLAALSVEFEEMGALLLGAETAVDAAEVWRRAGDRRAAAAAERRAAALAAHCEGARTPKLAAPDAAAGSLLSERELQIARLAATGLSNKDIAEALHLSPRTVENKLHTAYSKLGVRGRDELAGALPGTV